ncbi:hypothetical protein GF407_06310 [candidate division KSB1 bacterium]|nr:hypothetical protein [candidate division KSB1 bacterium]
MKKIIQNLAPVFIGLLGLSLMLSCGVKEVDDPLSVSNFKINSTSRLYTAAAPTPRSTFYDYETLLLSIEGLYPYWETGIEIVRFADKKVVNRLIVITDGEGRLINLPVWYHINVDADGHFLDESGYYVVHVQQASHTGPWLGYEIPFKVKCGVPPTGQLRLVRDDGSYKNGTVLVGESAYARGKKFPGNTNVKIVVIPNQVEYNTGDPYNDVTEVVESLMTLADGTIPITKIWDNVGTTGSFDVIADLAPFGEYNDDDRVCRWLITGLVAQNPANGQHIIQDIACDASGIHLDNFFSGDEIWAKVDPYLLSDAPAEPIAIFIAPHKNAWQTGDPLATVVTLGSMDSPTICVGNPRSESVNLVLIHAKSDTTVARPRRIPMGTYDVVVDVNRNYVYDAGIDLLDGLVAPGFSVEGEVKKDTTETLFLMTALVDLYYTYDQAEIRAWVVTGPDNTPVAGATVNFSIISGGGSLSQTSVTTDANGFAVTYFSGGNIGQRSVVKGTITVNGKLYEHWVSFWGLMPYIHNQGQLIGVGG